MQQLKSKKKAGLSYQPLTYKTIRCCIVIIIDDEQKNHLTNLKSQNDISKAFYPSADSCSGVQNFRISDRQMCSYKKNYARRSMLVLVLNVVLHLFHLSLSTEISCAVFMCVHRA